ncbi:rCG49657, partial [Rattus norvegicus]
DLQPGRHQG